jgi:hypothetical protein
LSARAGGLRGRLARLAAAIAALLVVAVASPARAAAAAPPVSAALPDPRPWDAPWIDAMPIVVPARPPEYILDEEAGIRLSYQPSTHDRVRSLRALAVAIRRELGALLGVPVLGALEIRVAAAPDEMPRLAPVEHLPGYATAVTFSQAHLVVMSALSPLSTDAPSNLEGWLRHALAHLALDEATREHPMPRWFHEGFAVQFAGEDASTRAATLARAALTRKLLGLAQIEAQFPADAPEASLACAEAADFTRFLGPQRLTDLTGRLRNGESWKDALALSAGVDTAHLELSWRKEMARRYSFVPVLGASIALWMIVAGGVLVRRARARRRRDHLSIRRERGERRARIARAAARRAPEGAQGRVLDDEVLVDGTPGDPEVPRIEHDGRWYTLH